MTTIDARKLAKIVNLKLYPSSPVEEKGVTYFLGAGEKDKYLGLVSEGALPGAFSGKEEKKERLNFKICPLDHNNAAALRQNLAFSGPRVIGVRKTVGFGDRLGLATPGHIRAVRGSGIAAVLAQQSMREMNRTGRSPEEVMDAATWGVFQEGFKEGFGADADHLKTEEDINTCAGAGFTMFTLDPSEYVDNGADSEPPAVLEKKYAALPWDDLETDGFYCKKQFVEGKRVKFNGESLIRAAVKYSAAINRAVKLSRRLKAKMGERPFELEVSFDETANPTSVREHFFIASELRRLGVEWVSLALRFVGDFEKGVDYKGSLREFEETFAQHIALTRHFPPYKIGIHSGSDKFSLYPIIAHYAKDLIHLKTAGTSYLEALRVVAAVSPAFFREILAFARDRYEQDKATYQVSADMSKVPEPHKLKDRGLTGLLDLFDARQVLHVSFGSVLTAQKGDRLLFRDRLLSVLAENEERYYKALERHLGKHVEPFK